MKMGEQPHSLIEDREVERRIAIAVVQLPAEVTEPPHVRGDERNDRPVLLTRRFP